jgi:hypothetical protein
VFSLLNPISLWFGAALAVPLMIHFLGRQRLHRQQFPSLLLVRERFSKSMHRHRLKNLLLLILRTLLILCLLLALSNPAIETRSASAKPDISLALVHNGVYGGIPAEGARRTAAAGSAASPGASGQGPGGSGTLQDQWKRIRSLDSSEGIHTQAIPVIADGPGPQDVSERFGNYGEAVGRVLAALGSRPGTARIGLPVFDWGEAASAKGALARALAENPGLQIVLTDYSANAGKADAFAGLRAAPSAESPALTLRARLSAAAVETAPGKAQVFLNGRLLQEASPAGGLVEVTLPPGEGPRSVGKVSLPGGGFAVNDRHFCFPEAGQWTLAHSGSAMASLPSLGRESYYRRIVHVASAKDIPWSGASATGAPPAGAKGKDNRGELRLAYLAAERGSQPEAYARAVEFVKGGGRLIIGAGKESDIPLLNRFLLQPLRMGRLGNLVESPTDAPVRADRQALAQLGRLPADPGPLGTVRKRFAFAPDSGVGILLSQGPSGEAVLAARDFHRGRVLLWTTDIDDLDWSDVGVHPLTPLIHQAFQENGIGDRAANLAAASDSIFTIALDQAGTAGGASGAGTEVRDPEGRAFTKVKADGTRLRIGPFDKLGIYRILTGKDTLAFAVNLAQTAKAGAGASDRKSAEEASRDAFLKDFKSQGGRMLVTEPDETAATKGAVRKLWPPLILAALLLLLLEGLISSTFSLRRIRPWPWKS